MWRRSSSRSRPVNASGRRSASAGVAVRFTATGTSTARVFGNCIRCQADLAELALGPYIKDCSDDAS